MRQISFILGTELRGLHGNLCLKIKTPSLCVSVFK